jgi:type II secretory pathway predicted ATPase ExeA
MNVLGFWKLSQNPFALSSSLFFAGGSVEEAIARTEFLVSSARTLGILLGPSGSGKTTLMQRFSTLRYATENRKAIRCISISAGGRNCEEVVEMIADSLSQTRLMKRVGNVQSAESDAWTTIRDVLIAAKSGACRVVLMLDGFVDSHSNWETVRRLVRIDLPVTVLVSIDTERVYELPSDVARLSELRIDLPTWELSQTADYFDFALESVEGKPGIFDAQAITRIHELSDGLPGRVRRIADLCLVAGSAQRAAKITSDIVEDVHQELAIYPQAISRELLSR